MGIEKARKTIKEMSSVFPDHPIAVFQEMLSRTVEALVEPDSIRYHECSAEFSSNGILWHKSVSKELVEKLSVIIESYGDHPCQTNLNCAVAEILTLMKREMVKTFRDDYHYHQGEADAQLKLPSL